MTVNSSVFDSGFATRTNGIIKTGVGTAIMNDLGDYNGTTTISGGVLQIGNGGASGSFGFGNVVNNASLVFNQSHTAIVNSIGGTGSVTFNYNDRIDIQGNNTYGGGTYINNGGLWLYPGATLGSGTVTITNIAYLKLQASSTMTLSNNLVLNGMGNGQTTGAINQDGGAGTVTLDGSITLAGDSRIGVGGGSWNSMVINGQITGSGKLYGTSAKRDFDYLI